MRFKRRNFSTSRRFIRGYRRIGRGYAPYNKRRNVHALLFRQSKGVWFIRSLGYLEPSFSWYPF